MDARSEIPEGVASSRPTMGQTTTSGPSLVRPDIQIIGSRGRMDFMEDG